jgi:hypothetical protein
MRDRLKYPGLKNLSSTKWVVTVPDDSVADVLAG